jgi:pimeloyl-ACP methyl ester carboxylesterase
MAQLQEDHRVLQSTLPALSRNSKQILVDSGHSVQLERPEVVVEAVREVVGAVRSDGRL